MEPEDEPTWWDRFAHTVYNFLSLAMTLAFATAGLAAVYLLWGLFSGQLAGVDSLSKLDHERIVGIVSLASQTMAIGLGIGTLCLTALSWSEESLGYLILAGAAALGIGVPFLHTSMGGQSGSVASATAVASFVTASIAPGVIGAGLIAWDVARRFMGATKDRPVEKMEMAFGATAEAEARPMRLSLMAKCWEGPYCRELIRPHCPIFIARKACWREKRGCMCEEEIVNEAVSKSSGALLGMAPSPEFNYANPATPASRFSQSVAPRRVELTMAQKRERCRNCIIYNEHEREKYKLLLPVVILGGIALVAAFSPILRDMIVWGFSILEKAVATVSLQGGGSGIQFGHPTEAIQWAFIVAIGLMFISKLVQALEWMCFEVKI